ncbi:ADAM 17-like protease isoform X1 [Amphiura filiformis]|uniref:ADAM 17-like protease isoform X1 n=1 Tax=Amphiura filiformis TaxID=82378 RepID=UPI003B2277E0
MATYSIILHLVLTFTCFLLQLTEGSLHHALHYYETLHVSELKHHVVRRNADEGGKHTRHIKVAMLGRQFDMELTPREGLLSPDFKAYSIKHSGKKQEQAVDPESFYTGFLQDDPDETLIKAHYDGDTLTAKIYTREDEYNIEPSWRHLKGDKNNSMIAYRSSDVKRNATSSYCPYDHYLPKGVAYEKTDEQLENPPRKLTYTSHARRKRAPPRLNTCPLLLTADYRFYQNMGQESMPQTINYLITLIDRVDSIYRETEWEEGYMGFGFEIKEVTVHEEGYPSSMKHYNAMSSSWDVQQLLEIYSKEDHSAYCLAHLFTYQDFSNGVLGLAYIGTPRSNAVGGICTSTYYSSEGKLYLNTGLTTTVNWGRRVLTQEADLVTAHELGHNFGSEHDPGTEGAECSPGNAKGGNYLMYPASVSGQQPKNKQFSPCSKRLIGPVLRGKASRCFAVPTGSILCGNYRVEQGEECDAGLVGLNDQDKCCSANCKLKKSAKCSDQNSPCCEDCLYAPSSKVCRRTAEVDADCDKTAYCNGRSDQCPPSASKADGDECIDDGKCRGGKCVQFCEDRKMVSCICEDVSVSCHRCCKKDANSPCLQFFNGTTEESWIPVPNGRPCPTGVCKEGHCVGQTQDVIERFFDVFEDIDISVIARIIKDNVVGATLIISLLIWIPCSCVIHHFDKKRETESMKAEQWFHPMNQERIRPEDRTRVRSSMINSGSFDGDGPDTEHLLQWFATQTEEGSGEAEEAL